MEMEYFSFLRVFVTFWKMMKCDNVNQNTSD